MKLLIYADDSSDAGTVAAALNGYLGANDCKFKALPTSGYVSILQPTYDQIDDLRINVNQLVNLPCRFTVFHAHQNVVGAYNEFMTNKDSGSSFIGLTSHHGEDQLAWANYAMEDPTITSATGQQAQFARQMLCYGQAEFKSRTPKSYSGYTYENTTEGGSLVFDGSTGWVLPNGTPQTPVTEYVFEGCNFVNKVVNLTATKSMLVRNFDKVTFRNCNFDLYNGMWVTEGVDFIVMEDCTSVRGSAYTNPSWDIRGCGGGRLTANTASGVVDTSGSGPNQYGFRITNERGTVASVYPRGNDDGYRGQGQIYPTYRGPNHAPVLTGNEVTRTITFNDRRFTDRPPVEYSIDVGAFSGRESGWVFEDNHLTNFNVSGLFAFYTDTFYHARNSGGNTRDGWCQYEWVRNVFVDGAGNYIDHERDLTSDNNAAMGLHFYQENNWVTAVNSASASLRQGNNGSPHYNVRYKNCNVRKFTFWHYSSSIFVANGCWWSNDTLVQNCTAYYADFLNNTNNDPQTRPNLRLLDCYFNNFGNPVSSTWNYVGVRINNCVVTATGNVFADNGFFDYRALSDWNNAVPKSDITAYSNWNEGASGYTFHQSVTKPDLPAPEAFPG